MKLNIRTFEHNSNHKDYNSISGEVFPDRPLLYSTPNPCISFNIKVDNELAICWSSGWCYEKPDNKSIG